MRFSEVRQIGPKIIPALVALSLQSVACLYFVADAVEDQAEAPAWSASALLEGVLALALLTGIVIGGLYVQSLIKEAKLREATVAIAQGALSRILVQRFKDWGLSAAESDVALFALKGCSIAEIADLRLAAPGTVRAQLSQVYAKAAVTSQPMLMSLFLDDLLDGDPLRNS